MFDSWFWVITFWGDIKSFVPHQRCGIIHAGIPECRAGVAHSEPLLLDRPEASTNTIFEIRRRRRRPNGCSEPESENPWSATMPVPQLLYSSPWKSGGPRYGANNDGLSAPVFGGTTILELL
jgi:hypothetical protein